MQKKESPLFTIIIPVYNTANYISKCLESIQFQSYEDWEAIIIDDGSTDGSDIICDEYAIIDSRFKVFHKSNGGVSSARNIGLDQAKGHWVWFIDSDDYVSKDALQQLKNKLTIHNCDTIFFGHIRKGKKTEEIYIYNCDLLFSPKDLFLERTFSYLNQTILFDLNLIKTYNLSFPIGIRMAEDLEFQYKYLIHCKRPISISESYYYYILREGSAMHNPSSISNNFQDTLLVCKNILKYIQQEKVPEKRWLSLRIRGLLKSCIQSAENIKIIKVDNLQNEIREILNTFKTIGYTNIMDSTLRLATFNLRIYFFCLRIYYKYRKYKQ